MTPSMCWCEGRCVMTLFMNVFVWMDFVFYPIKTDNPANPKGFTIRIDMNMFKC